MATVMQKIKDIEDEVPFRSLIRGMIVDMRFIHAEYQQFKYFWFSTLY